MRDAGLWLRWTLRDLRARWPQVAAIALIIALGSGVYSALLGTLEWRRSSYTASYAALHMYDLRFSLTAGAYVDAHELARIPRRIAHASSIDGVSTRLLGATQIDASSNGQTVLTPGRIVGIDGNGSPQVSQVATLQGRALRATDVGKNVVVLDRHYGDANKLPATGTLHVSGGRGVHYIGQGVSPDYFVVIGDRNTVVTPNSFAILFTSLPTAQRLLGHPGQANDLVVTLRPGANRAVVQHEVSDALSRAFPNTGFTVATTQQNVGRRQLYNDINGDREVFTVFALLVLSGAVFGAFNLVTRIIEAQRREIGIGMSLGAPTTTIAARPLLVASEIALLGAIFGVGVGILINKAFLSLIQSWIPLPVWRTSFDASIFLRGAALGFCLPLLATIYPIMRAVRVTPVEAIRTGYLAGRTRATGFATRLGWLPLPGRSIGRLPFRNVARSPRRSALTLLGIAATIAVLVALLGIVDGMYRTIDDTEQAVAGSTPDRVTVALDSFYPVTSPTLDAIAATPGIASHEVQLRLPGTLRQGKAAFDVYVTLAPYMAGAMWSPPITSGSLQSTVPSIVLTRKGAHDLHVSVGDSVTLRHPRREGLSYAYVNSRLPVSGITDLPTRATVFMDLRYASIMQLQGIVNAMSIVPKSGVTPDQLERRLFGRPGVASVEPVSSLTKAVRQTLQDRLDILTVVEAVMVLLALLIAFNTTSISFDERAREHATMLAFGMPVSVVMTLAVVESVIVGVVGTALGIVGGRMLVTWFITGVLPRSIPDLALTNTVATSTYMTALILGVLAVAAAPLFSTRKLVRMSIPDTLRLME
jgi:putative ABC transport system permease protein